MIEKLKAEASDYLRRLRSCTGISDDLFESMEAYMLALIQYAYYEGVKNTEQQLQPENGPVECHHNSCAGWVNGKCPNPGLCREWAVSG